MIRGRVNGRRVAINLFFAGRKSERVRIWKKRQRLLSMGEVRRSVSCWIGEGYSRGASGIPLGVEFEFAVATMGHGSTLGVDLQVVNREKGGRCGAPFLRQGKKEMQRTREVGGSELRVKVSESKPRTLAEGARMRHPENQRRLSIPDRRLCHPPAQKCFFLTSPFIELTRT